MNCQQTYAWLRKNFRQVDIAAYTHLLFEVSPYVLEQALIGE